MDLESNWRRTTVVHKGQRACKQLTLPTILPSLSKAQKLLKFRNSEVRDEWLKSICQTNISHNDMTMTLLNVSQQLIKHTNTKTLQHYFLLQVKKLHCIIFHWNKNIEQEVKVIWQKAPHGGAHSPVRGHPRGSKFVPMNSWGRVSY